MTGEEAGVVKLVKEMLLKIVHSGFLQSGSFRELATLSIMKPTPSRILRPQNL